jgi:hypothetical protein
MPSHQFLCFNCVKTLFCSFLFLFVCFDERIPVPVSELAEFIQPVILLDQFPTLFTPVPVVCVFKKVELLRISTIYSEGCRHDMPPQRRKKKDDTKWFGARPKKLEWHWTKEKALQRLIIHRQMSLNQQKLWLYGTTYGDLPRNLWRGIKVLGAGTAGLVGGMALDSEASEYLEFVHNSFEVCYLSCLEADFGWLQIAWQDVGPLVVLPPPPSHIVVKQVPRRKNPFQLATRVGIDAFNQRFGRQQRRNRAHRKAV